MKLFQLNYHGERRATPFLSEKQSQSSLPPEEVFRQLKILVPTPLMARRLEDGAEAFVKLFVNTFSNFNKLTVVVWV